MTKEKISKKQQIQDEKVKYWFMIIGIFSIVFILIFGQIQSLAADQITHKFKSPSFSGNGTSSHYLTIENQEFTRKMTIKEELQALEDELERDAENTTLARFVRNLESRIYAQLSRQLVDNLFGETPMTEGTFALEGSTISYTSDGTNITLTVLDQDGTTTTITIPVGSFTF